MGKLEHFLDEGVIVTALPKGIKLFEIKKYNSASLLRGLAKRLKKMIEEGVEHVGFGSDVEIRSMPIEDAIEAIDEFLNKYY